MIFSAIRIEKRRSHTLFGSYTYISQVWCCELLSLITSSTLPPALEILIAYYSIRTSPFFRFEQNGSVLAGFETLKGPKTLKEVSDHGLGYTISGGVMLDDIVAILASQSATFL
jgi:hypothetical protein